MTLRWSPGYAAVDADFDSVSLLLHGDGTNGSTTIVDSSPSPKTVTPYGNAQISTTESEFGGASMSFSNGYLLAETSSANFSTEPFTVEFWVYFNGIAGSTITPIVNTYIDANTGWMLALNNKLLYAGFSGGGADISTAFEPSLSTWYHFAMSGQAGVNGIRLFVDGVQQGSAYTGAVNFGERTLAVGVIGGLRLNGYIDDLRITKGVARYTSNFTPPTAPFPDLSPTMRLALP